MFDSNVKKIIGITTLAACASTLIYSRLTTNKQNDSKSSLEPLLISLCTFVAASRHYYGHDAREVLVSGLIPGLLAGCTAFVSAYTIQNDTDRARPEMGCDLRLANICAAFIGSAAALYMGKGVTAEFAMSK